MATIFKIDDEKETINTILKLSVSASLASLGIVLSVFVVLIPNFEFISVTIFLISLLFGFYYGALSAISISLVYEFIVTPIYGQLLLLFFFKLICYLLLVLITSLLRKILLQLTFWELGVFGAVFSLFFYIITTIGGEIIIVREYLTLYYLVGKLLFGIPFAIIHVTSNFALFGLSKTIINWINTAFKSRGIKPLMIITGINLNDTDSLIDKKGDDAI